MSTVTEKNTYVKPPQRRGNCGKWTITQERPDGSVCISPLYCEGWNCPVCRPIKIAKLVEKMTEVDLVQYIEIVLPHRYAEVRRVLSAWLKLVKRQSRGFSYFLVVRAQFSRTRIGLFLTSGTLPRKWVEESFATYGLTAEADTETLYRREGRRDKLTALLDVGTGEDTFIHRVSHSRKFYTKVQPAGPSGPKARTMVSLIPLSQFLDYVTERGLPLIRLLPDVYQVPASAIGDRGVKPFDLLFPDLAR